jgi:site-specific recombinase XerD
MNKEYPETTISPALPLASSTAASLFTPSAARTQVEGPELNEQTLLAIVENYIHYYASGSGHTARAKRYDLQYFLEFLASRSTAVENLRVAEWTLQTTRDFIDYRLSVGESPATVSRRLATLKHFGRTLAERVPGFVNPAREAKSPTVQLAQPQGLSAQEVQLLREAARLEENEKLDDYSALRNRFLLELLLATGLRADEVRLLTRGQISEDHNWLRNVKTKGKRFRNVYLDTAIRAHLAQYLIAREAELDRKVPGFSELPQQERMKYPVLLSLYQVTPGDPSSFGMSPKTIWNVIDRLGKKAVALHGSGISALHPHKLRHTFAHGLLNTSNDIRLVAQALGHSDVRTTMRYTERSDQEVAKAIEHAHRLRQPG